MDASVRRQNGGSGSAKARVFGTLCDKLTIPDTGPVRPGPPGPDDGRASCAVGCFAYGTPGRGSAGGGAGYQFGGGHGDGRDHRDRRPRADALGQRVRTAHRGHVHGAQPGRGSRPGCPVPVPRAPGAGRGEQRAAQLTAAGLPRGKEPPARPTAATADDKDAGVSLMGPTLPAGARWPVPAGAAGPLPPARSQGLAVSRWLRRRHAT